MAARFMRRSDGDALKREHSVKVLEEIMKQVSSGAADLYQLQFTVDDNENLKGLLVFNLGTEWDTFETLHNMNKDYGLETQVVDIVDEAEVWAETDIDLEGDDDFDEEEFRKMMTDDSQQTDIFERRRSILERRNSLQQTRKLSRRESIAFDEELKKLDESLIPREEDEDAALNQPASVSVSESEKASSKPLEERRDTSAQQVEEVERPSERRETTAQQVEEVERPSDGDDRSDTKQPEEEAPLKLSKKKLSEVDETEGESTAKRSRKVSFDPEPHKEEGDQQVPSGDYDVTDGSISMAGTDEDEAVNQLLAGVGAEAVNIDDQLANKEETMKKRKAKEENMDALARPDNDYLNNTGKTFDRSKFEQARRKSKLDIVGEDEDEDMIFAVLRRMRTSARKMVQHQDRLVDDLSEQRVLQRSPYM